MSLPVSKRMQRLRPSPTGEVLAEAIRLQAAGRDIINLGVGEPDFPTPEPVKDAAIAAIRANQTRYTPIPGDRSLRDAVRDKFERENGLSFGREQIIITSGAKQAIFSACLALLEPGDEAIIPSPYWVSYPDIVGLAEALPVIVPANFEQNFKLTPDSLEQALTSNSRLLILNSPCNPTGAAYSAKDFAALAAVIRSYPDLMVLSDEIYEHIHWDAPGFVSFAKACPDFAERTLTVNGVSKAYAMTGWRIGYAAGPQALIDAMIAIQSQSTTNACSISQAAALEALNGDQECVSEMAHAFKARHDFLVSALDRLPGFECRATQGTFYTFPKVAEAIARLGFADDVELARHLLNSAGVAVVPGSAFGAPGHLRLSFACAINVLGEAVDRIERIVSA